MEPNVLADIAPFVAPDHWTSSIKKLYCRHGFYLAIYENGCVKGTQEPSSKYAVLQFSSVAPGGVVRIKAVETGYYLAMNEAGCLYGERDEKQESTVFEERYDTDTRHNTYLSRSWAHLGWYLGIRKSGEPKPGPKTAHKQKAVLFLPTPAGAM